MIESMGFVLWSRCEGVKILLLLSFFLLSILSYGSFQKKTSILQRSLRPSKDGSLDFKIPIVLPLPRTNIAPENKSFQKKRIVFQLSIFRHYVSFRECFYIHLR